VKRLAVLLAVLASFVVVATASAEGVQSSVDQSTYYGGLHMGKYNVSLHGIGTFQSVTSAYVGSTGTYLQKKSCASCSYTDTGISAEYQVTRYLFPWSWVLHGDSALIDCSAMVNVYTYRLAVYSVIAFGASSWAYGPYVYPPAGSWCQ
jgi:hypothetical protein